MTQQSYVSSDSCHDMQELVLKGYEISLRWTSGYVII